MTLLAAPALLVEVAAPAALPLELAEFNELTAVPVKEVMVSVDALLVEV